MQTKSSRDKKTEHFLAFSYQKINWTSHFYMHIHKLMRMQYIQMISITDSQIEKKKEKKTVQLCMT